MSPVCSEKSSSTDIIYYSETNLLLELIEWRINIDMMMNECKFLGSGNKYLNK